MNSLLTPKEQKKMISYGKPNGTTYKTGGTTASKKSSITLKK
jgi:hypothetical protein